MKCLDCGDTLEIDYTPEFNEKYPYEVVCYSCGWFSTKRYKSEEEAREDVE